MRISALSFLQTFVVAYQLWAGSPSGNIRGLLRAVSEGNCSFALPAPLMLCLIIAFLVFFIAFLDGMGDFRYWDSHLANIALNCQMICMKLLHGVCLPGDFIFQVDDLSREMYFIRFLKIWCCLCQREYQLYHYLILKLDTQISYNSAAVTCGITLLLSDVA